MSIFQWVSWANFQNLTGPGRSFAQVHGADDLGIHGTVPMRKHGPQQGIPSGFHILVFMVI